MSIFYFAIKAQLAFDPHCLSRWLISYFCLLCIYFLSWENQSQSSEPNPGQDLSTLPSMALVPQFRVQESVRVIRKRDIEEDTPFYLPLFPMRKF